MEEVAIFGILFLQNSYTQKKNTFYYSLAGFATGSKYVLQVYSHTENNITLQTRENIFELSN